MGADVKKCKSILPLVSYGAPFVTEFRVCSSPGLRYLVVFTGELTRTRKNHYLFSTLGTLVVIMELMKLTTQCQTEFARIERRQSREGMYLRCLFGWHHVERIPTWLLCPAVIDFVFHSRNFRKVCAIFSRESNHERHRQQMQEYFAR